MNSLLSEMSEAREEMEVWRRHFHQYPELQFKEVRTASYIASLLKSWGYKVTEGVGKTGVVASLKTGQGGKTMGLRAEMDALPVMEAADREYASQNPNTMHACGHDGHLAMLLGAARFLAQKRAFNGTVHLIFQPSEETMDGALAMMSDGLFDRFPMDAVFGMHNVPILGQGQFYFKTGPMMAAVDNWEVELLGRGSHGSTPEASADPVVAGASLVMALQTIVARNLPPIQSAVVSVGAFLAGDAGNVIPHAAVLRLSIRSLTQSVRELVLARTKEIIAAQAQSFGVEYTIREGTPGAALSNDPDLTEFAAGVAAELVGQNMVLTDGDPVMGSEDFAFFSRHVPGCYCGIGGDTDMLHTPSYDFDDRNLTVGAAYWVALVQSFLT